MVGTVIFGILFVVSFSYYVMMISYAGIHTAFASVWLFMSIVFLVLAVISLLSHKNIIKLPVALKVTFFSLISVFLICFLIVEGLVASKMRSKGAKDLDYVIVMGAKVRGTVITKTLKKRLETAYDYLKNNPGTIAVLSGGQGEGEDMSEAQAMYEYLISKGIKADRLIKEDKSVNTDENIEFSMKKISEHSQKENASVGIITSNFHVYRTEKVCAKKGYKLQGIAAPSDNRLIVNYMFREFFAVTKYKIFNQI